MSFAFFSLDYITLQHKSNPYPRNGSSDWVCSSVTFLKENAFAQHRSHLSLIHIHFHTLNNELVIMLESRIWAYTDKRSCELQGLCPYINSDMTFSDGVFEEWNSAYIHVLLTNTRHGVGGTLTVFMCYGMNIWCVRESPDSFSDGMFVPESRMLPIHCKNNGMKFIPK